MAGLILPVTLDGDRIKLTQNYGDDFAWKGYSQYYRQYYGLDGHNGIDVGGWDIDGDPVMAAGDGTVVYAGRGDHWDSTVGGGSFTVVIHHPHLGIWTAYLHLRDNSNTVTAGQKVKQGQMIARAGNTGIGTGAHLHFQVMPVAPLPLAYQPNWGCVNPKPYMQTVTAASGANIQTQEDDMGYKDWSAADKAEMLRDVAFAVNGYNRRGEKVDLSHMVAYIYNAIKRVDTATQAIWKVVKPLSLKSIANAVARRPIVSRNAGSEGKAYGWDTFDSVTNAKAHDNNRKLDAALELLGVLAKTGGQTAAAVAEEVTKRIGSLKFSLTTLDETEADFKAAAAKVEAEAAEAADNAEREATKQAEAAVAAVPNAEEAK
jgi:murein DD-endopeptidase MepM/ murein hydrolase activator NlpD